MGLFDRLFGTTTKKKKQPNIRFGRYSDSYKTPDQLDAWEASVKKFDKKEHLESYDSFFQYLKDPKQNNVSHSKDGENIHFELLQGSKKITGIAGPNMVSAKTTVVKCDRLNVGFMRRLMEKNYSLKYSKFCLNEDNSICMKFDTHTIDGSPFKLYYALKEMSINADKQDDLLVNEFEMLHTVDTGHIEQLPELEKNVKYAHSQKWIKQTIERIESMDSTKYAGGITFLLLYLIYKLDYLIQPEGFMMESLERCHNLYFARDNKSSEQKSLDLIKELKKLLDRTEEDFNKEMYKVNSTFGITTPSSHEQVIGTIDGELSKMDWYKDNSFPEVAVSIPGYIAGYNLFNFAVPQPDREYLHLLIEIIEHEYFVALGIDNEYVDESGKVNKSNIKNEIAEIAKSNNRKYPKLNPNTGLLNFSSMPEFAKSFMLMVKALDHTEAEKNKTV